MDLSFMHGASKSKGEGEGGEFKRVGSLLELIPHL